MNSRSLYQFLVFFVGVCAVFLANQLAHRYHFRWDLTEEKRYTLHSFHDQWFRAIDRDH